MSCSEDNDLRVMQEESRREQEKERELDNREVQVKVKRMEKGKATFMEPYADREGYHEVTVEKYFWKCPCGLVWATRHAAQECTARGHKTSYERRYGGSIINGEWIGGRVYVVRSIRKEQ